MQLQGSAYLTEDLDFCYSRTRANMERVARAMAGFHPRLRNAPEGLPFRFDAETIARGMNFTLMTDLGAIDFLGEVLGLGNYEAVKAASDLMSLFGVSFRVLSIAGLIQAKHAAGRKRDLLVIPELQALLELKNKKGS